MKKVFRRTGAALLGASLMLATIVPAIYAKEPTQILTPPVSDWIIETLNEGEKYGTYPIEWYYDSFQHEIPVKKVNELLTLTEKKIASMNLNENKQYKPVAVQGNNTRGDIVKRLYNIVACYDLPVGTDAIKYMTERNILRGSAHGLQLEKKATTQQAVILAIRFIKDTYALAQQGVAWTVEDEDTLVYLLGSIHLGIPDLYSRNEKLVTAFDESDALFVEANVLDEEGMKYYGEKAMYTDDSTLKDAVTPETYAKLEQVAELYGLPMEQLAMQKPWFVSNTLSSLTTDDSFGLTAEEMSMYGVDMYFLLNALLAKSFRGTLSEESEFDEMLFGKRDEQMAQKLIKLLEEEEETYFVVVSAGHFLVDKNIRYHLEQNGYDVEPFYQ